MYRQYNPSFRVPGDSRLTETPKMPRTPDTPHLSSSTAVHQALHHPSIVSLLSHFSTPSAHYQVLDFCANGSLASVLNSRPSSSLSEPELRDIAKSLIEGLVYLRKQRVIHRDVKPSNLLLTDDFRIVIILNSFSRFVCLCPIVRNWRISVLPSSSHLQTRKHPPSVDLQIMLRRKYEALLLSRRRS